MIATPPLSGSVCSEPEKMVDRLSDDLATLLLDQQADFDFDQEAGIDISVSRLLGCETFANFSRVSVLLRKKVSVSVSENLVSENKKSK